MAPLLAIQLKFVWAILMNPPLVGYVCVAIAAETSGAKLDVKIAKDPVVVELPARS